MTTKVQDSVQLLKNIDEIDTAVNQGFIITVDKSKGIDILAPDNYRHYVYKYGYNLQEKDSLTETAIDLIVKGINTLKEEIY